MTPEDGRAALESRDLPEPPPLARPNHLL